MSSHFGTLFRVATWGESHGGGVGCVIDGCPSQLPLTAEEIQQELNRRRPGQSSLVTPRDEKDQCHILSGIFQGVTLGSPIMIMVKNEDVRSEDYEPMAQLFRPSHGDFTTEAKYGIRNWKGGGRSSARETIGRVAAGAVASKVLRNFYPELVIVAYVTALHDLQASIDSESIQRSDVDATSVRCPDLLMAEKMSRRIEEIRVQGDSVGGIIECVIRGVPAGLGEPVFDKLEADLAKAMMSIPATKGFEIGSGFAGARERGSEQNDPFTIQEGKIRTTSNHSGGIQGGISNGENILFRVAFKPTSTIAQEQETVTTQGEEVLFSAFGRHDPCVLPRAVPIIEAMAALVLCDHALRQKATRCLFTKDGRQEENSQG